MGSFQDAPAYKLEENFFSDLPDLAVCSKHSALGRNSYLIPEEYPSDHPKHASLFESTPFKAPQGFICSSDTAAFIKTLDEEMKEPHPVDNLTVGSMQAGRKLFQELEPDKQEASQFEEDADNTVGKMSMDEHKTHKNEKEDPADWSSKDTEVRLDIGLDGFSLDSYESFEEANFDKPKSISVKKETDANKSNWLKKKPTVKHKTKEKRQNKKGTCERCHDLHVKCFYQSTSRSCERCFAKNLECVERTPRKRKKAPEKGRGSCCKKRLADKRNAYKNLDKKGLSKDQITRLKELNRCYRKRTCIRPFRHAGHCRLTTGRVRGSKETWKNNASNPHHKIQLELTKQMITQEIHSLQSKP
ncbi:hypothetical protein AAMO2058_001410400 [Amorphochlora amoebiformis]